MKATNSKRLLLGIALRVEGPVLGRSFYNYCDARTKENIKPYAPFWKRTLGYIHPDFSSSNSEIIRNLKIHNYNYKKDKVYILHILPCFLML
jgi:hypothetical protein